MRPRLELGNQIFEYIKNHQGYSNLQIRKHFNHDKKTIYSYLQLLKREYKIIKINERYYALNSEKEQMDYRRGILRLNFYEIVKQW